MTRHDELISVLRKLLPGATFGIADCRDWCSITFAGQRLTIIADFDGVCPLEQAQLFAASLPEQEFALPGAFVADIAVVNMRNDCENVQMKIDALVLDE